MSYVAQPLPTREQAIILRDALALYIARTDLTEDERTAAWNLLAKLTSDMMGRR